MSAEAIVLGVAVVILLVATLMPPTVGRRIGRPFRRWRRHGRWP